MRTAAGTGLLCLLDMAARGGSRQGAATSLGRTRSFHPKERPGDFTMAECTSEGGAERLWQVKTVTRSLAMFSPIMVTFGEVVC